MIDDSDSPNHPLLHRGADHSSPYPVSRLAREIEKADRVVAAASAPNCR